MNAVPAEKNFGDPTSKYPDAAEIPQVKIDTMQKPEGANPVVSAFETLMKYAQSLEQRKDPKAAVVKQHLTALVQTIASGAEATSEPPVEGADPGVKPVPKQEEEQPKIGYDPFKDPSEDEQPEEMVGDEEQMRKRKMMKKPMKPQIEPLV